MTLESSLEIRLITIMASAHINEDERTKSVPEVSATAPGRKITRAPTKPSTRAMMRRAFMDSPSKTTAPSEAKRGDVKLSAEAKASGVVTNAVKNINMVHT